MTSLSTKPPSGTRDFLGAELQRRRHAVDVIQRTYEAYGFVPLETPALENLSTLLGKYGDEGDQLMYRVLRRGEALTRALADDPTPNGLADLGLRYDLTVPLARVVAGGYALPRLYRRYQIQPVWRAERAAKGRYREFFQCDVDITGSDSALAEAEVITAVADALTRLGFAEFDILLNHRGLLRALIAHAEIPAALEGPALVALDKLDKIGADGVRQELGARGISAASVDALLALTAVSPAAGQGFRERTRKLAEALDPLRRPASAQTALIEAALRGGGAGGAGGPQAASPLERLDEVYRLCEHSLAGRHLVFAPQLARGLGYYTGCIFEIVVPGVSGSVGGGGRYDGLVGMFGKNPIPAVGFSLGLERILNLMDERGLYPPLPRGPEALVCWTEVPAGDALALAQALREPGPGGERLRVELYPEPGKLKKQLQYANEIKAMAAALLGPEELSNGQVTLKHLERGEQVTVPRADAAATLRGWR